MVPRTGLGVLEGRISLVSTEIQIPEFLVRSLASPAFLHSSNHPGEKTTTSLENRGFFCVVTRPRIPQITSSVLCCRNVKSTMYYLNL